MFMARRKSTRHNPGNLRGVYEEPYRMNGRRVFFSMDSHGEHVGFKTAGTDAEADAACEELWYDLNLSDPLPPDASPMVSDRPFRVIRGGLGAVLLALSGLPMPSVV